MSFSHGKDAVLVIGGETISTYVTSVKLNTGRAEADVTACGAAYKDFLPGVQEASLDIEGIWDATLESLIGDITSGDSWVYQPQGPGTGNLQFSGTLARLDYNIPTSVDDAVTWDVVLRVRGAVTHTVL